MIKIDKYYSEKILRGIYLSLFIINLFSKRVDGPIEPFLFIFLVLAVRSLKWDAEEVVKASIYPFSIMLLLTFFEARVLADKFAVLGVSLLLISVFQKIKRYLDENKIAELKT